MSIKHVTCCDNCEIVLQDNQGFAVVGNIHVTDPKQEDSIGDGLVGNNLRKSDDQDVIDSVSHFCKDCLVQILFCDHMVVKPA